MAGLTDTTWRTSTRSQSNGACVEVRRDGNCVEVRDTKDRCGPVLRLTAGGWSGLVRGIRAGEFDL